MQEYLLVLALGVAVVCIFIYLWKQLFEQGSKCLGRINEKAMQLWNWDLFFVFIVSFMIFISFVYKDRFVKLEYMHGILVIVFIIGISIIAFRFNLVLLFSKITSCNLRIIEESLKINSIVNNAIEKRNKSDFKKEKVVFQNALLEKALRSRIYLRTDLTIEILAHKTQIPSYRIPQLFATEFNSNFNNVINGYRIKYAIKILNNKENKQTIQEIATTSGFNSRSSFYRVFKLSTGITPSEYKKRRQEQIHF